MSKKILAEKVPDFFPNNWSIRRNSQAENSYHEKWVRCRSESGVAANWLGGTIRGHERSGALQTRKREGVIRDPSPRGRGHAAAEEEGVVSRAAATAPSPAPPVLRRQLRPTSEAGFLAARSERSASEAKWRTGTADVGRSYTPTWSARTRRRTSGVVFGPAGPVAFFGFSFSLLFFCVI
jgi:hypothetical protein